jgi:hypothetical protein
MILTSKAFIVKDVVKRISGGQGGAGNDGATRLTNLLTG